MYFMFALFTLCWIVTLVIEWRLWRSWHGGYFRIGLPILKKKIPSTNKHVSAIKNLVLDNEVDEVSIGKLSLKRLSEREVAVRNKHFFLGMPARGRITFNPDLSVLKMQIFIDWFVLVFILYMMAILILGGLSNNPVSYILGLIGGSIIFYVILIEKFLVLLKEKD